MAASRRRTPSEIKPASKNIVRYLAAGIKKTLRTSVVASEEWFRQCVIWYYKLVGNVVVFDRHFFVDYYAHDVQGGAGVDLVSRLHGMMLSHLYPKPDVVVLLDAPADVLFARKQEGTVEILEALRQDYLQLREVMRNFHVVDATQPPDAVTAEISNIVQDFHAQQVGKKQPV